MGDVRFTNSCSQPLYVAYMRFDEACGADCGDPWDVLGWVNLHPGETETRSNPSGNRWFYYYAEAQDGTFWAGEFVAEVSDERFQKCTCIGVSVSHGPQPFYEVGFREHDLEQSSGLNFIGA